MQKTAIVRQTDLVDKKRKNVVIVEPLARTECAACTQHCSKKGQFIPAINNKNFNINVNSLIIISTSKTQEAIQGIVCFIFPIIMAIIGFILSNPIFCAIYSIIKKDSTQNAVCPESIKSLIVILFFALASLIVLILTRAKLLLIYPEITDVLEPKH